MLVQETQRTINFQYADVTISDKFRIHAILLPTEIFFQIHGFSELILKSFCIVFLIYRERFNMNSNHTFCMGHVELFIIRQFFISVSHEESQ